MSAREVSYVGRVQGSCEHSAARANRGQWESGNGRGGTMEIITSAAGLGAAVFRAEPALIWTRFHLVLGCLGVCGQSIVAAKSLPVSCCSPLLDSQQPCPWALKRSRHPSN